MPELNIWRNVDYTGEEKPKTQKEQDEKEKKGFHMYGMYVVGSTKRAFERLLEEIDWMKF